MVESEAKASGRSVAAVIRGAIDLYFERDLAVRVAAGHRLLALTEGVQGDEPDWAETKALLESNPKLDSIA
ncbi:MAG: hypothetical protein WAL50_09150 [Kineosporiaceae bacterium]